MEKVLFLSYELLSKIWGSPYFKEKLNITDKDDIGEMWSASGHKVAESTILNGLYKGQSLTKVYNEHPELFNYPKENQFPVLIKLISTSDNLSIQVHPDDSYAKENENSLGKTEGWLILDCKEDSSIILGHKAKNKEEIIKEIKGKNIENILNKQNVKVGDVYPIPAGIVHGLGKNITLVEVQQSSDVTYRIYDYNRKDSNGNYRLLHVEKAIDVIDPNPYNLEAHNCFKEDLSIILDNEYFRVRVASINGTRTMPVMDNYQIVTVIDGDFILDDHKLNMGESFIITSKASDVFLKGIGKIIITTTK